MVHGDGLENRSPAREAQVRILYPPQRNPTRGGKRCWNDEIFS